MIDISAFDFIFNKSLLFKSLIISDKFKILKFFLDSRISNLSILSFLEVILFKLNFIYKK